MALCIRAPFCAAAMQRSFPALLAALTTTKVGFRMCEGIKCGMSSRIHNRELSFSSSSVSSDGILQRGVQEGVVFRSPVSSGGIFHRAVQLGFMFRSARVKCSFREQGVVEESQERVSSSPRLILYSKPGCCLCDGLKEKLEDSKNPTGIRLEIRDITTNSEWWNSYQYEIPVLARVRGDGSEEPLPRLSPRLSAEQVQKKIHLLMTSAA